MAFFLKFRTDMKMWGGKEKGVVVSLHVHTHIFVLPRATLSRHAGRAPKYVFGEGGASPRPYKVPGRRWLTPVPLRAGVEGLTCPGRHRAGPGRRWRRGYPQPSCSPGPQHPRTEIASSPRARFVSAGPSTPPRSASDHSSRAQDVNLTDCHSESDLRLRKKGGLIGRVRNCREQS